MFHDTGNLNIARFQQFDTRQINNYSSLLSPIQAFLKQHALDANIGKRNELLIKGKKISGTAQFTDRKQILSHATLLVNANKTHLSNSLKNTKFKVATKSIPSHPSPIENLEKFHSDFNNTKYTMDAFTEFLKTEFKAEDLTISFEPLKLEPLIEKYRSKEYRMLKNSDASILWGANESAEINNGIITEINRDGLKISLKNQSFFIEDMVDYLKSKRFDSKMVDDVLNLLFL